MHDHHNVILGFLSGIPGLFTFLLISNGDVPLWLYMLTAVFVPVLVGLGGKAADIAYEEWLRKEESGRFRKSLDIHRTYEKD